MQNPETPNNTMFLKVVIHLLQQDCKDKKVSRRGRFQWTQGGHDREFELDPVCNAETFKGFK